MTLYPAIARIGLCGMFASVYIAMAFTRVFENQSENQKNWSSLFILFFRGFVVSWVPLFPFHQHKYLKVAYVLLCEYAPLIILICTSSVGSYGAQMLALSLPKLCRGDRRIRSVLAAISIVLILLVSFEFVGVTYKPDGFLDALLGLQGLLVILGVYTLEGIDTKVIQIPSRGVSFVNNQSDSTSTPLCPPQSGNFTQVSPSSTTAIHHHHHHHSASKTPTPLHDKWTETVNLHAEDKSMQTEPSSGVYGFCDFNLLTQSHLDEKEISVRVMSEGNNASANPLHPSFSLLRMLDDSESPTPQPLADRMPTPPPSTANKQRGEPATSPSLMEELTKTTQHLLPVVTRPEPVSLYTCTSTALHGQTSDTFTHSTSGVVRNGEDVGIQCQLFTNDWDAMTKAASLGGSGRGEQGWSHLKSPLIATPLLSTPLLSTPLTSTNSHFSQRMSLSKADRNNNPENNKPRTIHWQKGQLLAHSHYGPIFTGHSLENGDRVVVKSFLSSSFDFDGDFKSQLLATEFLTHCRRIHHENLLRYYFLEKLPLGINVFMEYSSQGSVLAQLQSHGAMPIPLVISYAKQMLNGLRHLHSHNVLHTNLRCANVMRFGDGIVKLSDWGPRSIALDHVSDHSQLHVLWASPELLCGERLGPAADIWSFGCTVMEMLTGNPPWAHVTSGGSPAEIASMLMSVDPSEHLVLPDVPNTLAVQFLRDCLRVTPEERPSAECLLVHEFLLCMGERSHTPYRLIPPKSSRPSLPIVPKLSRVLEAKPLDIPANDAPVIEASVIVMDSTLSSSVFTDGSPEF
eukprot:PhF_6_TR26283/c1_g1_i1/m.37659